MGITLTGGATAGTFIESRGAYRATWRRNTAAIAAAEALTLGGMDSSQATLAARLDENLAGTGFYRGSPLSWDGDRITWDLVAVTAAGGLTTAQAAAKLQGASPLLILESFGPRARVATEPAREAERATATTTSAAAHPAAFAAGGWGDKLWTGLKAFGLTAGVLAAAGVGLFLYLQKRGK